MSTTLAAGSGFDFTLAQQLTVIALCALTAFIAHMALAVFNDGVRPFLLDFIQGRTTRSATTAVSFGLSAGFIFGLGAPMALSTGVLNPWLLFLPTDILGLLSPKKWLAPILGGAWGAVVVFGLNGANNIAHDLPVDFLTAMQQMSTPILFLFTLFPVLAITKQFGRLRGAVAGVVEVALVVLTMKLWPNMFAGALAMAVGVLMLIGLAVAKDLRQRRADRSAGVVEEVPADDPMASLFSASATRLRRYLPLFMVLGAGVCVLAQMHVFGGGEATSFLIAKGQYAEAAQVDFYRVFGFIPLIATTALASGAYGIAGFTLVYPIGYLMPNPFLAAVVGALVFAVEVLALSWIGKVLGKLPSVRDSSEHLRSAIGDTLQLAILFGSLMAANAMGGGLGILIVGGLYLFNEAMGRPVVKMAAAPAAVIVGGVLLNLLYWLDLFTPVKG
ncbi:YhfT family protein [Streptomyces sp. MBT56]|uniref:YhfT family protein n=1 Tax=unclassified Streptomyces TaxID=2593676 RepID=UPI00190A8F93|nr:MULTISPECIES: YhfT family protein [unclassified Streptomyces]MBK3555831.1 YhfT family protein [Streptomyces sp. MBT56]MBK3601752.1 YhfT family protein [Streptomyces sp. MBT54]MBK3614272.1 YhfT family protein [Streptomyces sp. MBT98]MBK6044572.1 YhfT family protein [Streptomyces sp. MBT55]